MRDSFADQIRRGYRSVRRTIDWLATKKSWASLTILDLHHPAIATARQCFNVSGLIRGITERYPQSLDSGVDAVFELDDCIVRPELLPNLGAQHDLAGLRQQNRQNLKRLLR